LDCHSALPVRLPMRLLGLAALSVRLRRLPGLPPVRLRSLSLLASLAARSQGCLTSSRFSGWIAPQAIRRGNLSDFPG
jgi:hypothetical protein